MTDNRTFRIYGDSFVADDSAAITGEKYNWAYMLAEKLGYRNVINNALPGSSLECSIVSLFDDVIENKIRKDDFILFNCTSATRCPLHYRYYDETNGHGHLWVASDIDNLLPNIKDRSSDAAYNFYSVNRNFYNLHSQTVLSSDLRSVIIFIQMNSVCDNTLMTFNSPVSHDMMTLLMTCSFLKTQHVVNTNLGWWSQCEFTNKKNQFNNICPHMGDFRNSHLSKSNHILVADKLYFCFKNNISSCDDDFLIKDMYDTSSEEKFLQTPDSVIEYELSSYILGKFKEIRVNKGISPK